MATLAPVGALCTEKYSKALSEGLVDGEQV